MTIVLFAFKGYDVLNVVSVREHVYRTYSCDDVVLAEDFKVTGL
jgi:hypothetical protein